MIYKCLECGLVFDEYQRVKWQRNQEELDMDAARDGCPMCFSEYSLVKYCDNCMEPFLPTELYEGYCEECLCELVNYKDFFAYLLDTKQLVRFVFSSFWQMPEPSKVDNELLISLWLTLLYQQEEDLKSGIGTLMDCCLRFVMEENGESGRFRYARWIRNRQEKFIKEKEMI